MMQPTAFSRRLRRALRVALLLAVLGVMLPGGRAARAAPGDLYGPSGSAAFGMDVRVLPNGNIVVADPGYDAGAVRNVGAVYLYDGATRGLVSVLTGSAPDDGVGSYGITVLPNSSFIVLSPFWDNGGAIDAGAATWVHGARGLDGPVSSANSLVGQAHEWLGYGTAHHSAIWALGDGDYVVHSPRWNETRGALTWGDGDRGITGTINDANSLLGSTAEDLNYVQITEIGNGNMLVRNLGWDNGASQDAGAVTWISGAARAVGAISSANSLIGSSTFDNIGRDVLVLSNGNYLVRSHFWDNASAGDAGAVTWGDGARGVTGTISSANSLVGTSPGELSHASITEVGGGNYLVRSEQWRNGNATNAGAVTWGDGDRGVTGTISSANSLIGSSTNDHVGREVLLLPNGNFLVISPLWDRGGAENAGAITWGSAIGGVTGTIDDANSLVGSSAGDQVGSGGVEVLESGNYVVISPFWDNGSLVDAGAVTWGDAAHGVVGAISSATSLIGGSAGDQIGAAGVTALRNGHYVVSSPSWANGSFYAAGAATWGDGTRGATGVVSTTNSLVGRMIGDRVGEAGATALPNGHYVLVSPSWRGSDHYPLGAVTWADGARQSVGVVGEANSLVGSNAFDSVGSGGVVVLSNSNYLVQSPLWRNSAIRDVGAITWGSGTGGVTGRVSSANSLVGSAQDDLSRATITALSNGNYLVQSRWWDNGSAVNAGAVAWGDGDRGLTGTISSANALVGGAADDQVGADVTLLSDGDYVVRSPLWDSGGIRNAGAATWGSGLHGVAGAISGANSLVGSALNDQVGSDGVTALSNGSYVVSSPLWDSGAIANAGAASWGDGDGGLRGPISSANSLIGSHPDDQVSRMNYAGVRELSNGHYVVRSRYWSASRGALTWGDGAAGVRGVVSPANSLVGDTANDQVGHFDLLPFSHGNYVLHVPLWDNGEVADTGAVVWFSGVGASHGAIGAAPGIFGTLLNSIDQFTRPVFDPVNGYALAGIFRENRVAILQAPAFTSAAPAAGAAGGVYRHAFTARGSPPPSFTLAPGSTLPDGLSLSSAGVLSGTPAAAGMFTFTVVADNGIEPAESQAVALRIHEATVFTSAAPPAGVRNTPYQHRFTAHGVPTISFGLAPGSVLPAGLTLDDTGILSGTPGVAGTFGFTVVARNTVAPAVAQEVALIIQDDRTSLWLPIVE